jgi:hypothetical protein
MAATSAEKQAAIDAGLAYLASTQNAASGYWNTSGYPMADTAAALLAFVEQSYKPLGWNGPDYSTVVTKATNYLLQTASTLPFATSGNWWGFGAVPVGQPADYGIRWSAGGEDTYITASISGVPLKGARRSLIGWSQLPESMLVFGQVCVKGSKGHFVREGYPSG